MPGHGCRGRAVVGDSSDGRWKFARHVGLNQVPASCRNHASSAEEVRTHGAEEVRTAAEDGLRFGDVAAVNPPDSFGYGHVETIGSVAPSWPSWWNIQSPAGLLDLRQDVACSMCR